MYGLITVIQLPTNRTLVRNLASLGNTLQIKFLQCLFVSREGSHIQKRVKGERPLDMPQI